MKKIIILGLVVSCLPSAFADTTVGVQYCITAPFSSEQICSTKSELTANTFSYQITISDYGQTITVDSNQSYPLVDPEKLQQGMASIADTGFNSSEMAHLTGPTEDLIKAVASGTLSSNSLRLQANSIAKGFAQHTPAN